MLQSYTFVAYMRLTNKITCFKIDLLKIICLNYLTYDL